MKTLEEYNTMNIDSSVKEVTDRITEDIIQHMELFACAFAKITQLPPDRIVMCQTTEYRNGNLISKIWFEERHI